MALTKQARAMRIINITHDGQRVEIAHPRLGRIVGTVRKRKAGGFRWEIDEYPDGTKISVGKQEGQSK